MSVVQQEYEKLIDAMPVHAKLARAAHMVEWSRDRILQQVLAEKGSRTRTRRIGSFSSAGSVP